jgi:hypothetical protein
MSPAEVTTPEGTYAIDVINAAVIAPITIQISGLKGHTLKGHL